MAAASQDLLGAMIENTIRARNEKRAAEGKPPYSAEEIDQIRQHVAVALNSESTHKLAELMKDGAGDDFKRMGLLAGLAGGAALFTALINGCPNINEGRRKAWRRGMKMPDNLRLSPDGRAGGQRLEFPKSRLNDPVEEANIQGDHVVFMLHVGAVSAEHDLEAEFAKLKVIGIRDEEIKRIQSQCAHLLKHAQGAYERILAENGDMLDKMRVKMGEEMADKFKPTVLESDRDNSTLYLSHEGKHFEPRCGLMITRMPSNFSHAT